MPQRAFTLIELLVVIGIIAILAGMLFPAVRMVMDSSQSVRCAGNLRQLGMCCIVYSTDNERLLPDDLWNQRIHNQLSSEPIAGVTQMPVALCPRHRPGTKTSYALSGIYWNGGTERRWLGQPNGFAGLGVPFVSVVRSSEKALLTEFDDGAATLAWGANKLNDQRLYKMHKSGSNVVFLDGHVQLVQHAGDPYSNVQWSYDPMYLIDKDASSTRF